MTTDTPAVAPNTAAAQPPDPRDVFRFRGATNESVHSVFMTPLAVHRWQDSDDLNAGLCDLIFNEEARTGDVAAKNVGIWYTDHAFMRRDEEPIRRLRQRAMSMAIAMTKALMKPAEFTYSIDGWANVLRSGQYNNPHIHRRSVWSGVYYVTGNPPAVEGAPNPRVSGQIEFIDPRPGAFYATMPPSAIQRPVMLNPDAGTMILFPSWLMHMVHPYHGPTPRVIVAFNVNVRVQGSGKKAS
ncbi:MAG: TIGR02466 family protein [Pseudomonadota bacterium]